MWAFSFSWTEYGLFMLALILVSVGLTSLCGVAPGTANSARDDA